MGRLSKAIRFEVLARDGFRCRYCGAAAPDAVLVVDHVTPVFRGGEDDLSNLVAACTDCNSGKSDRELIPMGIEGFKLTPDRRPGRMAKMRHARAAAAIDPHRHELDTGQVDSLDEIDEDSQLALVWCDSHGKYEWHNIPRDLIGRTSRLVRITRAGWRSSI